MGHITINAIYLTDQELEIFRELHALVKNNIFHLSHNTSAQEDNTYLTAKEAAAYLKISIRTLWVHIHEKESFPFTKSGRKYLIKKIDLVKFMGDRSYHPATMPSVSKFPK